MKIEHGKTISSKLAIWLSAANDNESLMSICTSTGYGTTTVRNLMKGKAIVNQDNECVILEATKVAVKKYTQEASRLQEYIDNLKNLA